MGRILLTAVAALAAAAAAAYFVGFGKPPPPPKPSLVNLGTFVTNLDDPAIQHYIKVSVSVLVPSSAAAALLQSDNTSVESAVLSALQGTTVEEAVGTGAEARLGLRLERAIDRAAPGVRVLKIYFTQFIVE